MTAQELIYKAIKGYDDYANKLNYTTDDLDDVTTVNSECMRLGIGIKPTLYEYETDGTETEDGDYKRIPLPVDLTEDDQILAVDTGYSYSKTETYSGTLYLYVPVAFTGSMTITYLPKATQFTSLSEVIQISDDAANLVARWMLAELLAERHRPSKAEKMATKARIAKATWKGRGFIHTEIIDEWGGYNG